MSETNTPAAVPNEKKLLTTKDLFSRDDVKQKFQEMLGKNANGFMVSVLQTVNSNDKLKVADPMSVYQAAATAAAMNLPINNNLGFAAIVPYNERYPDATGQWKTRSVAQFQMQYKGFIQLGLRTGQFKNISAAEIYEGQLISEDPLKGNEYDFKAKKSDKIIGYAAYFCLTNGFEKDLYWTVAECEKHGKRYSKSYENKNSRWKEDFDKMALKTVLKMLLSKYAPLSIDLQNAIKFDQAVIKNAETGEVDYVDTAHEVVTEELPEADPEEKRRAEMLAGCETWEDLEMLKVNNPDFPKELIAARKKEIEAK